MRRCWWWESDWCSKSRGRQLASMKPPFEMERERSDGAIKRRRERMRAREERWGCRGNQWAGIGSQCNFFLSLLLIGITKMKKRGEREAYYQGARKVNSIPCVSNVCSHEAIRHPKPSVTDFWHTPSDDLDIWIRCKGQISLKCTHNHRHTNSMQCEANFFLSLSIARSLSFSPPNPTNQTFNLVFSQERRRGSSQTGKRESWETLKSIQQMHAHFALHFSSWC